MPPHDDDSSDSDIGDYTTTNVLLGYASNEPTDDPFSQLGGHPTWHDPNSPPSASLAKCKVCQNLMSLLLQLNGDLPDRCPGHERRLYVFGCRGKKCQKKEGSIRAIRGVRVSKTISRPAKEKVALETGKEETKRDRPPENLGNAIFNSNLFSASGPSNLFSTSSSMNQNPFSSPAGSNPFQISNLASKPPQRPAAETTQPAPPTEAPPSISIPIASNPLDQSDLTTSFAHAVSLSSSSPTTAPHEPWPTPQNLPPPYPYYHLDAEYETLSSTSTPTTPRISNLDLDEPSNSGGKGEEGTYESEIDKTFQRFADRLAQNAEQVLRYEFGGAPLLYSKNDAVGRVFSPATSSAGANAKVTSQGSNSPLPRCTSCGGRRVFELQLTPHAILELESSDDEGGELDIGMDGMEWGTVIVGVCAADCGMESREGEVLYREEWVGVQWEESRKGGRR